MINKIPTYTFDEEDDDDEVDQNEEQRYTVEEETYEESRDLVVSQSTQYENEDDNTEITAA